MAVNSRVTAAIYTLTYRLARAESPTLKNCGKFFSYHNLLCGTPWIAAFFVVTVDFSFGDKPITADFFREQSRRIAMAVGANRIGIEAK